MPTCLCFVVCFRSKFVCVCAAWSICEIHVIDIENSLLFSFSIVMLKYWCVHAYMWDLNINSDIIYTLSIQICRLYIVLGCMHTNMDTTRKRSIITFLLGDLNKS